LWREADCVVDRLVRWALAAAFLLVLTRSALLQAGFPSYAIFAITPLAWSLAWMWLVHCAARGFRGWPGRILRARPLVYIGTISYGIYLIHLFVMPAVTTLQRRLGIGALATDRPGPEQFVLVTVLSIAAAAVSWRYFERPINSLKTRFPYVSGIRMAGPRPYDGCIADRT
jgi:peptidoglycan/LPS O-acetylase OafA/YrhL